ncbi:MAG: HEAT repeat domain-containing protein [Planctomycetes bacterium]|nr:HEAT repeat domain-containing protein [Planctomycetota bacterium]MCB9920082.1 HEAT repeat domain-containing protein [Planctomycetota bacterium]
MAPTNSTVRTNPIPVFLASLAVFAGIGAWLHWRLLPALDAQTERLRGIEQRLDRIENSVELLHFGRDPEGWPVEAVLGYLETWAEREQQYGSSILEQPVLEEHIGRGVAALRAIGPSAYDQVERRFVDIARDPKQTPYAKRLLRVLAQLDPQKCRDFLVAQLTDVGMHSPIRTCAGELLQGIDAELAGAKIRQILLTENYRGSRHGIPTGTTKTGGVPVRGYPGFASLVNLYLRSHDSGKSDTLLVVLRTPGHDVATYQGAVDGLIEAKDPESVETIRKIFEGGPETTLEQRNALLRRKLARAVAEIQGTLACPWLREMFARETDEAVRMHLGQLLQQWC